MDAIFQYPRSDRAHCNRPTGMGGGPPPNAFSILGRIEPTATNAMDEARLANYRLSVSSVGSSPLQLPRSPACPPGPELSVSSVGSSPLQPPPGHATALILGDTFSILGRIEPTATSTTSSNPCFKTVNFQYPRSDRAHCNLFACSGWPCTPWLSVSSVGSSPLQRGLSRLAFVIRLRIFQYPRSDRAHCNAKASTSGSAP